jgi:hypothetical protein
MPVGTSLKTRFRNGFSAAGYIVRNAATSADSTSPTITSGAGAPTASEPDGSMYLRTNGTSTTTLYLRVASAWVAK